MSGSSSQPDGAVADVLAAHPGTLVLINRGETVWATRLHGKPAVAGASSVWPATTTFMNEWLATHPHAFTGPTAVPLLRFFGTRYLLLHMTSDWEKEILEEARQNPELKFVPCFDPPAGPDRLAVSDLRVRSPAAGQYQRQPGAGGRLVGPGGLGRVGGRAGVARQLRGDDPEAASVDAGGLPELHPGPNTGAHG